MNFDDVIDRRGTNSDKWDNCARDTGADAPDALAMWTADMDFRAGDFLQAATSDLMDIANYGYFTGMNSYRKALCWWMNERHGWTVDPRWVLTTGGLGNAIALAIHAFTEPGDHVVTFNPVYHEFELKIRKSGRVPTQLPLRVANGVFDLDFDSYDAMMTGREKLAIFCSPHNPAGRVWTQDEYRQLAAFCERHDLLLISDEIHHDLVYPGHKHIPAHVAVPEITDRLIMMTSASKTFNIAGLRTGAVIIPDDKLRSTFAQVHDALEIARRRSLGRRSGALSRCQPVTLSGRRQGDTGGCRHADARHLSLLARPDRHRHGA